MQVLSTEVTRRPVGPQDPPLSMVVGIDDQGNYETDLTHTVHDYTAVAFLVQAAAHLMERRGEHLRAVALQAIASVAWSESPDINGQSCPDCGQPH